MEEIAISKFKATCLEVLERVRTTRRPVRVTRFGKPVAEVNPPSVFSSGKRRLGMMMGTARIKGDIIAPANALADSEAVRK